MKLPTQFYKPLLYACLITLTACSGGGGGSDTPDPTPTPTPDPDPTPDQFTIGGTITGLEGGITLSLNGTEEVFTTSSFTFSTQIADGSPYGVAFVSADNNQSCSVTNGTGTATENVTNIDVNCAPLLSQLRFVDAGVEGHLASGDYNGDGNQDLVIGIRTNEFYTGGGNRYLFRIMWGNGTGGFTQGDDLDTIRHSYPWMGMTITTANLNNDSIDDIAVVTGRGLEAYIGRSSGAPIRLSDLPSYSAGMMIPADVTGDGNEDYVSLFNDSGLNFFSVLPGNGDSGFDDPIRSGAIIDSEVNDLGFSGATTFTLGDFNGDGLSDILSVSAGVETVMIGVFIGNGDGSFSYPSALQAMPEDLHRGQNLSGQLGARRAIANGDIDGDGDIDAVIASSTDYVLTLINDGVGNFATGQRILTGSEPTRVLLFDLNLDGRLDLMSLNQASLTSAISWGQSDGSFGNRGDGDEAFTENVFANRTDFADLLIADFDANGFPDLAFSDRDSRLDGFASGSIQILMNPGQ